MTESPHVLNLIIIFYGTGVKQILHNHCLTQMAANLSKTATYVLHLFI